MMRLLQIMLIHVLRTKVKWIVETMRSREATAEETKESKKKRDTVQFYSEISC